MPIATHVALAGAPAPVIVKSTKLYAGKNFHYKSCTPTGPAQRAFPNTVQYIDVLNRFSRWQGRHADQDRWYAPNGRLYDQSYVLPFTGHGPTSDCGSLRIAGKRAARLLGRWTYRLYVDGFLTSTKTFTLTRRAATAGTTFSYTNPQTNDSVTVGDPIVDTTGDAQSSPPAGKEFFILHVIVHNGRSETHYFSGLDFHPVDQNGATYERTFDYPSKYGRALAEDIPGGGTRKRIVVFVIPQSTTTIKLGWDDSSTIDPPKVIATFHPQQARKG